MLMKVNKKGSGSPAPKDPNVTIIAVKDIVSWPTRNSKKVLMVGNFAVAPNAKMAEVYMTSSKTKAPYESDGDEDAVSLKHKFEGEHPGDELEINEFIADWLGEPCIIIHGSCQDAFRKVVGTKCAPVQLKPSGQNDNDARKHMLVFEQFAKTEWLPGHYLGALPTLDPVVVTDITPVNLFHLDGYVHQLPSVAVTEAIALFWASMPEGSYVTLIGGGGAGPATLSSGAGSGGNSSILLKNNTPWVALDGATITLEAYNGNYFIERSRTE